MTNARYCREHDRHLQYDPYLDLWICPDCNSKASK